MEKTFRPKGSSVKALQLEGEKTFEYAAEWCSGRENRVPDGGDNVDVVEVPTLEGVKLAKAGDYIIRIKGEGFKVMDPAEFEHRYEPVRNTRNGD